MSMEGTIARSSCQVLPSSIYSMEAAPFARPFHNVQTTEHKLWMMDNDIRRFGRTDPLLMHEYLEIVQTKRGILWIYLTSTKKVCFNRKYKCARSANPDQRVWLSSAHAAM